MVTRPKILGFFVKIPLLFDCFLFCNKKIIYLYQTNQEFYIVACKKTEIKKKMGKKNTSQPKGQLFENITKDFL